MKPGRSTNEFHAADSEEVFGSIDYYLLADGRHAVEVGVWVSDRSEGSSIKVYFDSLEEAHKLLAWLKR